MTGALTVTQRALFAAALAIFVLVSGLYAPEARAGEAAALGPVTKLPLPRFVSIRSDEANARRGPGLDYRIDWTFVQRGLPVEVTAEHGQWRRVQDADGLGGWVHRSLLSGARTGLVRGQGTIPLRAEPEAEGRLRALVEPGALAQVASCDGAWCRVRAGNVQGWLPQDTIWGVTADERFD
ncbi:MAG: SH3 domain-containing protein [Pseudomonadota bacterium]